jgi:tetratricopeptide (TPR) repeat protein
MSKTAHTLWEFIQNPSSFTEVHLYNNNITNDDCAKLAAALKGNNTVTHVYLNQNQIGEAGAAAIAEAIKVNKTVRQLDLLGNPIGDMGAATIAEAIKVNNTLTMLFLLENQIGGAGAAALAEGLKVNKTITQVGLNQNQIGDQGAAALAEILKGNNTILALNLTQNQIGDQGAAALAEILKGNNTMYYLNLQQNQIGDQGAAALAEVLKGNNTMLSLYLQQNQIGDQGLNLLKASWQGNPGNLTLDSQGQAAIKAGIDREATEKAAKEKAEKEAQQKALLEAKQRAEQEAAEKLILKVKLQEAETKLEAIAKAKQAKQEAKAAAAQAALEAQQKAILEAQQKLADEQAAKEAKEKAALDFQLQLAEAKVQNKGALEEKWQAAQGELVAEAGGNNPDAAGTIIIKEIIDLISQGYAKIPNYLEKGIFLFGNTGAGKSTLASLLVGRHLEATEHPETGDWLIDPLQPHFDMIIGHEMASETKIPDLVVTNNVAIWDCPGFNDTVLAQEIANIFYVKRLFETTGMAKFVLVVTESDITDNRGGDFLARLSSFMKTFSNVDTIGDSLALVVTHVKPRKTLENITKSVQKILSDNQSVTPEQRSLVEKLLSSSCLHLFHEPKEVGEFTPVNPLAAIESTCKYMEISSGVAGLSLSAKALEYSSFLLDSATGSFNKILGITTEAIVKATDCLAFNQGNHFVQNYPVIKGLVPAGIHYNDLVQHPENEYFLGLDLLSKLKKVLGCNINNMPDALKTICHAVELIAEYTESGNVVLKNQIQDYGYCLWQQYEYIKFFSSVCGKELPQVENIAELLRLCQAKVDETLEAQVSGMFIDQNKLDLGYYAKAIEYLGLYPEEAACTKLKAICYSRAGDIQVAAGEHEQALANYLTALKLDNTLPETYGKVKESYGKVGELLFNAGNYAGALKCFKEATNLNKVALCFEALIKLNPNDAALRLETGDYYLSIGKHKIAAGYYKQACSLSQDGNFKAHALQKQSSAMTAYSQKLVTKAEALKHQAEHMDVHNPDNAEIDNLEGYQLPVIGDNAGLGAIL